MWKYLALKKEKACSPIIIINNEISTVCCYGFRRNSRPLEKPPLRVLPACDNTVHDNLGSLPWMYILFALAVSCLQHVEFKASGTWLSELSGRLTTSIWKENSGQLRSCSWTMIYEGFHDKTMLLMRKWYTFHKTQLHECFHKQVTSHFWPVFTIRRPKASLRINNHREIPESSRGVPEGLYLKNQLLVSSILFITWTTGDPSFIFYRGTNSSASSHAL